MPVPTIFRTISPRRRTPEESRYFARRGALAKVVEAAERLEAFLRVLKVRHELLVKHGRNGDAEEFRIAALAPAERRVVDLRERQKRLTFLVESYEREQDEVIDQISRRKILGDELRKREQRLKAAEFELARAQEQLREVRQEIEGAFA